MKEIKKQYLGSHDNNYDNSDVELNNITIEEQYANPEDFKDNN